MKWNKSTSTLQRHVNNVHSLTVTLKKSESQATSEKVQGTKQSTIENSMAQHEKPSLEESIAYLAAMNRMSFRTIGESEVILRGLRASNFDPPTCHKTVSKMVRDFAAKVKADIKAQLKEKAEQGHRFSLTTDELTKMPKKFANLNIHLPGGETVAIGLMRVRGRLPAERAKEILCAKLEEYGLSEDRHLVWITMTCNKYV